MSFDDVAERLDVTKGSLYYYFAGKDELVSAAIETLGSAWPRRLAELPTDGPPAQRLRVLVREHVTVAVDTTLHCLHAAMSQASAWFAARRGAAFDEALDRLVDTVLMLVGVGPRLVA